MSATEKIICGAWGLLGFVLLIVYLRWMGTSQDQRKDEPSKVPKERNAKQRRGR